MQTGNPNSASSQRMQADVQRNVNQQTRIENGIKSGELTNHEVAKLEKAKRASAARKRQPKQGWPCGRSRAAQDPACGKP
ncbi:hypothetical protein LP419_09440 [Massilia sp. H-1]|nr:hypothetical protein LP419_09440 [Massilia sp. H-1]